VRLFVCVCVFPLLNINAWTNINETWYAYYGTGVRPNGVFINTSNMEILERFQSQALRMIVDSPWYVPNTVIRRDLQIPTVKEEIRRYSSQYSAPSAHTQMT
jgi:hypothetical protein